MSPKKQNGFHIAPFGIDGQLVGLGFWEYSKLSEHWLRVCQLHLKHYGSASDIWLGGNLSHIRIKWTSSSDASVLTLYVHDHVASSILLLTGSNSSSETQIAQMFVESLRNTKYFQEAAKSTESFAEVLSLTDRPMMAIVPVPADSISEEDHALVRELGLHFAGAFFGDASANCLH